MRAEVYAAFRRCFTYPDEGFVKSLRSGELLECLSASEVRADRASVEAFLSAVGGVLGCEETSPLEHLQGQYSALFIYPAYFAPYESVYLGRSYSAKPFLTGEVLERVERLYREHGYRKKLRDETADHLANELGFVEHLLEKGEVEKAKSFLRGHLLLWVPELVEEMEQGTAYWRSYGRYICEDRFCRRREQTEAVPAWLLERACRRECGLRVSDYPEGVPAGVEFYLASARLLLGFLKAEAGLKISPG